jgi:succinate-semialdehyde dehydrogenase / glutarate-semialdehyde dehydrogenase
MMLRSVNPATGTVRAEFAPHSDADIDRALSAAVDAQVLWRRVAVEDRVKALGKLAHVLRENRADYARIMTEEMGKPIRESLAEVEKCAWCCDYYAEQAPAMLADETVSTSATESYISYDPLGVVLAVMPWNYPFWQVFRFLAPALAAGNGAILKHASNVPECATMIADAVQKAGLPEGLFATLLVSASKVESLIKDPRIAAVTLTGSTEVGMIIAAQAGSVIKKQVLELGGSDPFIVLADADLDNAAQVAAKARFHNAGQSCISPKRFIVEEAVADEFIEALCAYVDKIKLGDPLADDTDMGPMARTNLRADMHEIVAATIAAGARAIRGGSPSAGIGAFYPPTLLDGVDASMPSFRIETFGPVGNIVRASDAKTAIALANDTEFGLGASLWTTDIEKGRVLMRDIDAGAVFMNALVASDPRIPFGGIKMSGYGRELGVLGLREFTNIKTNVIA